MFREAAAAPILQQGVVLRELRERGAKVVHGMSDATALDASGLGLQDHICFLHPHLGLSPAPCSLLDEAAHAHLRHSVLVAHYLSSANGVVLSRLYNNE